MSTRSMIAVMHGNKAKAVYCHWDGYVAHNGAILVEHYDSVKANKLVSMGDISSLRPNIGEAHAFSSLDTEMPAEEYEEIYGDMCTFYGRDRGEKDVGFKVFPTLKEAEEHYTWSDYYYCFKYTKSSDYTLGEWHYKKNGERWKKLAPAIAKLDPKECAE